MKDTSPKIEAKMQQMLLQKTPEERLEMGCSMFDFAKDLVKSSILQENPGISSAQLREKLFLRFYGSDFNPTQQQKIIQYLIR